MRINTPKEKKEEEKSEPDSDSSRGCMMPSVGKIMGGDRRRKYQLLVKLTHLGIIISFFPNMILCRRLTFTAFLGL